MSRYRLVAIMALLGLLLNGCGWHWRGTSPLPSEMAKTYLMASQVDSALVYDLIYALKQGGVEVVDTPAEATAVLALSKQSRQREVLSTDRAGKAAEYGLFLEISFSLKVGNVVKIPSQRVRANSEYSLYPSDALGTGVREDEIFKLLRQRLVEQIVTRLRFSGKTAGIGSEYKYAANVG